MAFGNGRGSINREAGQAIAQAAKAKKRVKSVVSNGQIPHLWMHKAQPGARNSNGSLYFAGDTIYSYGSHFPIARHVTKGKKEGVLFNTASYSPTTSGHQSRVRSAIPDTATVFNVPKLADRGYEDHANNLKHYTELVAKLVAESNRGKSEWKIKRRHEAAVQTREEARAYAKFFGLPVPKIIKVPELNSEHMEQVRKAEAARSAKQAAETKRKNEERARREAEALENWRKGEGSYFGCGYCESALRIKDGLVETSRGARVPIADAMRALTLVRATVKRGEVWTPQGLNGLSIGNYPLNRIEANGDISAGCHKITFAEIERFAPELEREHMQARCKATPTAL
jgi:hypothetical protein